MRAVAAEALLAAFEWHREPRAGTNRVFLTIELDRR
jgi:hypothetical protein